MDSDRRVFDSIVQFVGPFSSSEFSVDLASNRQSQKFSAWFSLALNCRKFPYGGQCSCTVACTVSS